jgi:hypothetical protein
VASGRLLKQVSGMSGHMRKLVPCAGLIGVEVASAEKERIEAGLLVRPDFCN